MSRVKAIVLPFFLALAGSGVLADPASEAVLAAHAHAVEIGRGRKEPTPSVPCIALNCGVQAAKCALDNNCRHALGCSVRKHGRFQCINDFENDVYEKLVYCMFNQHDCMGTKKTYDPYQMCRPLDETRPMATYLGHPLTKDVARRLLMRGTDHRGDWLVALGKSPAFDCFDCQYFYWGYSSDKTMYYHADYKIHKSDGSTRWQSSNQVATEWPHSVARYALTAQDDQGLFRQDDWRMLAADESHDPPSWIAMYYCGGAPGVANAYEGAMVLTPDGSKPDSDAMPIINALFAKANITLKCDTDNSNCSGNPKPPSMRFEIAV